MAGSGRRRFDPPIKGASRALGFQPSPPSGWLSVLLRGAKVAEPPIVRFESAEIKSLGLSQFTKAQPVDID